MTREEEKKVLKDIACRLVDEHIHIVYHNPPCKSDKPVDIIAHHIDEVKDYWLGYGDTEYLDEYKTCVKRGIVQLLRGLAAVGEGK